MFRVIRVVGVSILLLLVFSRGASAMDMPGCWSTAENYSCATTYRTYCLGELQCETIVSHCMKPRGSCVLNVKGPRCDDYGHFPYLRACDVLDVAAIAGALAEEVEKESDPWNIE